MYPVANEEIRKSVLMLLRPLVRINFIMGTCPCLISSEGQIKTPYKYFNFGRFFFIVACFLFFSVSALLRVCVNSFSKNSDDTIHPNLSYEIGYKGDGKHGAALATFVDVACGFYMNLIPAVFLCIASCKRKQILSFFDTMSTYVSAVSSYAEYEHIKRVTSRLYFMHGFISLIMAVLLINRFVFHSTTGPGNTAIWFFNDEVVNPKIILWASTPFVVFMCCAKAGVTAFIEVSCVSLACCMCKVIENVQEYLNDVMKNWQARFLEERSLTSSILNHGVSSDQEKGTKNDLGKSRKIQIDFQNYLDQINQYGKSVSSYSHTSEFNNGQSRIREDFCVYPELTPGQQIIYVINKFQAVRNVQTAANGLFGFVLAINTGLMVFISVVLKYMLIWNFGNLLKQSKVTEGNETVLTGNVNSTVMDQHHRQIFMHTDSTSEWTMFALYDFCFMARLIVLVICLGNVHSVSLNFNSKLAQALLQAQNIGDIVEVQGLGNKYFQGRPAMTVNEANTALAFITGNSANPLAFSAAGLFCFSRSLVLVIISIIITYLVFLLQV